MKKIFLIFAISLVSIASLAADRVDTLRAKVLDVNCHDVLVASHRGDWRGFCENTMEGILSAVKMGVDIVEIDVQRTKDGQLILMHDEKLNRTTNGKGFIKDWTLDSIRTLYIKNGCGIKTKQRVPTLEEVLIATKGKVLLNLDKADRYFDQIYPMLLKTGTARQIVMKGHLSAKDVKAKFGKYLGDVIYMPIVNLDSKDAEQSIEDYIKELHSPAFELLYGNDANTLPLKLAKTLKGRTLEWFNSMWDTMTGSHYDDRSLTDIDNGWGYIVHTLNAHLIQTDRPEALIEYLRSQGLHQ